MEVGMEKTTPSPLRGLHGEFLTPQSQFAACSTPSAFPPDASICQHQATAAQHLQLSLSSSRQQATPASLAVFTAQDLQLSLSSHVNAKEKVEYAWAENFAASTDIGYELMLDLPNFADLACLGPSVLNSTCFARGTFWRLAR